MGPSILSGSLEAGRSTAVSFCFLAVRVLRSALLRALFINGATGGVEKILELWR